MQDKEVREYCLDIAESFVEEYNQRLDENIDKMLREFGFEGTKDDCAEFLEKNGYQLLFDSEQYQDYSTKTIYLAKGNRVVSFFVIKVLFDEDLSYEISDILACRDED